MIVNRDPHLMVYGSSYDRGLEWLLKMWPDIKKEVPDARLRIFYGWNLFDVVAKGNPNMQEWKKKMNDLMGQDGITDLGRISHEAVKVEFEKAAVWAYPTSFGEISCITAMKAQAFGAIPCVINYAALVETVQYGVKVEGDIYDKETKDEYRKALVSLLNDPARQEEIRKVMVPWARKKFAWSEVAKQWDAEFKSDKSLDKKVRDLMLDNQALKAWDLVKDTNSPIKERVWLRVKHAFDDQAYKDYYSTGIEEYPVSEDEALNIDKRFPRFGWIVPKILEGKFNYPEYTGPDKRLLDLGCADGYLCLTIASKDENYECTGYNLYRSSVVLANERAQKLGLDKRVHFFEGDLFEVRASVDVVVMMEVLEHLPDPQKGVDHAMNQLHEGGHAFFSTPKADGVGVQTNKANPEGNWDDGKPAGHLRLLTEKEYKDLFKEYKIIDFYIDEEDCMCLEATK